MLARTVRRLRLLTAGAAAAGLAAVLLAASPGSAHVTVNPNQAVQGGFAKLAFRVPNESDTASTVKLEVTLPTQAPIAFLSLKPVAGWTATVEKTKLATPIKSDDGEVSEAVSKITWMSAGADSAIKAGQFQEFEVSAGPLPEVDQIVFKALQTYSDGTVVRWIEEPVAGGKEPEHPAPILKLAKKTDAAAAAATTSPADVTLAANRSENTSNGWAPGWALPLWSPRWRHSSWPYWRGGGSPGPPPPSLRPVPSCVEGLH